jgi:hypothetical protein
MCGCSQAAVANIYEGQEVASLPRLGGRGIRPGERRMTPCLRFWGSTQTRHRRRPARRRRPWGHIGGTSSENRRIPASSDSRDWLEIADLSRCDTPVAPLDGHGKEGVNGSSPLEGFNREAGSPPHLQLVQRAKGATDGAPSDSAPADRPSQCGIYEVTTAPRVWRRRETCPNKGTTRPAKPRVSPPPAAPSPTSRTSPATSHATQLNHRGSRRIGGRLVARSKNIRRRIWTQLGRSRSYSWLGRRHAR